MLEVQPVVIILFKDTMKEMITALRRFNIIYVICISFACIYTAGLLLVLAVNYMDKELYKGSVALRAVHFTAKVCKLVLESLIIVLFAI